MGAVSTAGGKENKSFSCKGKSGLHITTCANAFIKLCSLSSQLQADEQKLGSGWTGQRVGQQSQAPPLPGSGDLGEPLMS